MSKKISQLDAAGSLDGSEQIPVVKGGATKRTTAQAIADLGGGSGTTPISSDISNATNNTAAAGEFAAKQYVDSKVRYTEAVGTIIASTDAGRLLNQEGLTSLVIGTTYRIQAYFGSEDFTNVGAASNAIGVIFVATGTTPTLWVESVLIYGDPALRIIDNTIGDFTAVINVSSNSFNYKLLSNFFIANKTILIFPYTQRPMEIQYSDGVINITPLDSVFGIIITEFILRVYN